MKKFQLALVTGASTGIGRAIATLLAEEGTNLIITARDQEKLVSLAKELEKKVNVNIVVTDLGDKEQRKKILEEINKHVPDLIINNAGFGYYGEALTKETEASLNMIEVNVSSLVEFSLESARRLFTAGKKGVIINVSSCAAFQIFPGFSLYSATKTFVNRFSESFDEEMKPYGIRVLACCPGMVDTEFQTRASSKNVKKDSSYMSASFAAREIRKQIESGQKIRAFNWPYRLAKFLTQYLVPNFLIIKALRSNPKFKLSKKPFIETKY